MQSYRVGDFGEGAVRAELLVGADLWQGRDRGADAASLLHPSNPLLHWRCGEDRVA